MIIDLISAFITLCNIGGCGFISIVSLIVVIFKICTYSILGLFALLGVRITTSENKDKEEKKKSSQNQTMNQLKLKSQNHINKTNKI